MGLTLRVGRLEALRQTAPAVEDLLGLVAEMQSEGELPSGDIAVTPYKLGWFSGRLGVAPLTSLYYAFLSAFCHPTMRPLLPLVQFEPGGGPELGCQVGRHPGRSAGQAASVWAEPFSGLRATKKSSTSATTGVAAALLVAARLGGAGLARLEAVGEGTGRLPVAPGTPTV